MKLITGLNPYGISYHLGLHARGTARANPNPVGLRGYIELAREFGARSLEIWDGALIEMSEAQLIALRDELRGLGMVPIVSTGLERGDIPRLIEIAGVLESPVIRAALTGVLCGVAGAYISLVYTPLWVEGMVAGKGWIALALTTFATWRPLRVLLGAYLFGGVTMLQFQLQGQGVQVPSQLLTMLPYLATIAVLVLISRNPTWIRINMPASLGKPFHPGA